MFTPKFELHVLYTIHYHPFYIEIKFLAVYYIFYSPLSSLYEPNGIFTPFILCINISFKINTCTRIPTKLTIDRSKKKIENKADGLGRMR